MCSLLGDFDCHLFMGERVKVGGGWVTSLLRLGTCAVFFSYSNVLYTVYRHISDLELIKFGIFLHL